MKKCYIKTKNNFYLVSESPTLIIERGRLDNYAIEFESIKSANKYIKRVSKYKHMKKFIPLSIELKNKIDR